MIMKKRRILFIVHNRKDRSPGQRFRFEQYLDFLEQNGFEYVISPLLNEKDDKIFYGPGNLLKKAWIVLKGAMIRKKDLGRADTFDVIFLFREAFFTGSSYFEKQFRKSKARLIFDFDDAIWIDNVSDSNKAFAFLKDASKTSRIIALCDAVFAGNSYLKDYALKFNSNVYEIPTTIDTNEYQRVVLPRNDKIIIGWSGSVTTIKHFEYAVKVLKRIMTKYPDKVSIKVIGDGNYWNEELSIKGLSWNKSTEILDLSSFDIGIMPLPDDEWAKGKCGLKGLQYMALEIPTIMSPVGVNKEIIKDGENGFLASTEDEWLQKLSALIESEELRKKMGKAGRKTVEEKFSVDAIKNRYLTLFNKVISE
jgi:glycosyltransferase involved in cell wall biosynthesis